MDLYIVVFVQSVDGCLFNNLFRRRSKKTSKLRVTGLCEENLPGPVTSPNKGPVMRKMFPFDDVIMVSFRIWWLSYIFPTILNYKCHFLKNSMSRPSFHDSN